jgi:hypothetical protein
MPRSRVAHMVGACVMLGASAAWCTGLATNTPPPDQQHLPPKWSPVRSERDLRSIEEWAAIAAASSLSRSCLELVKAPMQPLTGEDLVALTRTIINDCFARQGSSEQSEQVDALPFMYARHSRTGIPLELAYKCGCVVPTTCSVYARLQDVREDHCCGHGEVPVYNDDLGGTYGGCVPRELISGEPRSEACPAPGAALPARSRPARAYRGHDQPP